MRLSRSYREGRGKDLGRRAEQLRIEVLLVKDDAIDGLLKQLGGNSPDLRDTVRGGIAAADQIGGPPWGPRRGTWPASWT